MTHISDESLSIKDMLDGMIIVPRIQSVEL